MRKLYQQESVTCPETPIFSEGPHVILQRRKWQCTPVFLPGKSHGRRSLAGYHPCGHKESDMNTHTHTFHSVAFLCGKKSLKSNRRVSLSIHKANYHRLSGL